MHANGKRRPQDPHVLGPEVTYVVTSSLWLTLAQQLICHSDHTPYGAHQSETSLHWLRECKTTEEKRLENKSFKFYKMQGNTLFVGVYIRVT